MRPSLRHALPVVVLLSGVAASGCDRSPTSPSANVAGAWSGTWQFRTAGVTATDDVTAALTQIGTTANGTWSAQSGPTGQLTFTVSDSFTGTLTISQTMFTGQVCTGSTTVSGSASSTSLEFTAATIAPSGLCQWATEMRFSLRK